MQPPQTLQLIRFLKEQFRSQGLHYPDLAARLSVGERTIKRYLSGHCLTLDVLEKLCLLAGTRLSEVALQLEEMEERPSHLSREQEAALGKNLFAAFAFRLLRHGWSARKLQDEFALDDTQLSDCLRYLQDAGLIEVLPDKRVIITTKQFIDWSPGGAVRQVFDAAVKQGFEDMDYGDPRAMWELKTVKIVPGDLDGLRTLVRCPSSEHLAQLAA